ncbi:MAG TPA: indole-3-glycerol phosphate synthase TrpC [Kofleriaceae bacterium]|nr:indole-3-glycerol phosphate synthase TrpC [Kofleriaceae bacterium]
MSQFNNILNDLISHKHEEVRRKRTQRPIGELEAAGRGRRPALSLAQVLAPPGTWLIAEVKRQSLMQEAYRADFVPEQLARLYAEHGAVAISILVDEIYFGGSPKVVEEVASAVGGVIPLIYKEFIIDPYQVAEAYALGADAVLIIARPPTDPAALRESISYAHALGMDTMVEIFTAEGASEALAAGARVIGVNNREYPKTTINIERGAQIRATLPPGTLSVSETGLKSPDDVRRARQHGYNGVLIGEAILTAPDVAAKVRELSEAGRAAATAATE